ncbi:unnamed protein product [Strongylus vulgaris]|uniref:Uncharacterized protein n=1 Tax=Strongylus vulgaris TaxID=40348 RepID=A0A3P7JML6_STRVU|nr:unnamed protein product [Strongylus vulgaris]
MLLTLARRLEALERRSVNYRSEAEVLGPFREANGKRTLKEKPKPAKDPLEVDVELSSDDSENKVINLREETSIKKKKSCN